jgi:hypothetical protein
VTPPTDMSNPAGPGLSWRFARTEDTAVGQEDFDDKYPSYWDIGWLVVWVLGLAGILYFLFYGPRASGAEPRRVLLYTAQQGKPADVEFDARPARVADPRKIPSNQDIKDGVRRPLDTMPSASYPFTGYDYYAEYRARYGRAPGDADRSPR